MSTKMNITIDANGNYIQTYEVENPISTERDPKMDELMDEIMALSKKHNEEIFNLFTAIKKSSYKEFSEQLKNSNSFKNDNNDKTVDIVKSFFDIIERCKTEKDRYTAYRFFTKKENQVISDKAAILTLWAIQADELCFKILEKKSFDIEEKVYDYFFDTFKVKLEQYYRKLWQDELENLQKERKQQFLTVQSSYKVFNKLSKDISKMVSNPGKIMKI